jgi:molybdenum-dependent DNA-binding transcriptional regulator ModE
MSRRYNQLCDLLRRPQGCSVAEAARELGVTAGSCRGMIRDLKGLLSLETVYLRHGGRGKGQQAIHYVRQTEESSAATGARVAAQ